MTLISRFCFTKQDTTQHMPNRQQRDAKSKLSRIISSPPHTIAQTTAHTFRLRSFSSASRLARFSSAILRSSSAFRRRSSSAFLRCSFCTASCFKASFDFSRSSAFSHFPIMTTQNESDPRQRCGVGMGPGRENEVKRRLARVRVVFVNGEGHQHL